MSIQNRMAVVAGLLAISGAAASAEMRADVPFAFTTPGGGQVAAGPVTLRTSTEAPTRIFTVGRENGKRVIVSATQNILRKESKVNEGSLLFRCADGNCALAGVFAPGEMRGWAVHVKRTKLPPATQISEIRVPLVAD